MTSRRETIAILAGAAAALDVPMTRAAKPSEFYDKALVIDALCFGKEWGEAAFEGLSARAGAPARQIGRRDPGVRGQCRGWNEANLEKLLGLNWLRLFGQTIG